VTAGGRLEGRVILVTGAGSSSGRRIAVDLAAHGAKVAVNDINPDRAEETVARIEAAGGEAMSYIADVSKKFSVQSMFNAVEDQWGRLDILVNNARILPARPLLDMDEWDWRRTLDVNLTGVFVMMQIAGRLMRAGGGGTIVNVARAVEDPQGRSAYLAALAGMRALTETSAGELQMDGIRVLLATAGEAVDRVLAAAG